MAVSNAIDQSAVARVVGIETAYVNLRGGGILYLPQRVALVGQGASATSYATTKVQVQSANEVGTTFGFGSPLHLAALQLLPTNGDGIGTIPLTVYPLEDDASGVVATGSITPSGTPTVGASYQVKVNNVLSLPFVISVGDTVANTTLAMTNAINGVSAMPIIAVDGTTVVNYTTKWKGLSANYTVTTVEGSAVAGNTFVVVEAVGGLVNPDVQDGLDQIGGVWETLAVNCMELADTTALTAYSDFNEGRWGALVRKPLAVVTGVAPATLSAATTVPDARKTDRTNISIPEPGGTDLPCVIAARAVARIAPIANNNPPQDYGSQAATGLTPGADSAQWDFASRDTAVKAGSSTVEVRDGVVYLSDTVTFYHPTGDALPAYRFLVDIIKLQNIIFNTDLRFNVPAWDGAPLIPDDQPTTNRSAKKPKTAKAEIAAMIDGLALEAIISDPKTAKESIVAAISSTNPKRLDVSFTVQLAGNSNIKSIDLNFGFYFGSAAAA